MCIRDRLKDNLKSDKQLSLLSQLTSLEDAIENEAEMGLDTHRDLIVSAIEENLAARTNYQKGKFYQKLKNDTEIDEAIALLQDPTKYSRILGK